jgi:hypothetical protein
MSVLIEVWQKQRCVLISLPLRAQLIYKFLLDRQFGTDMMSLKELATFKI